MSLASQPLSEREAEVDLVLIQTSALFLWKLCLKNTSFHKKNMIYIIKQEGLYQNKVTPVSFPPVTVKWPIVIDKTGMNLLISV